MPKHATEPAPLADRGASEEHFELESLDLARLALHLQEALGPALRGSIVGRTQARDEVVRLLGCSQLQAEEIVDTLILRGILVRSRTDDGMEFWSIRTLD